MEHADLAGKAADDIARGIHDDADDADSAFPVWYSHPADDPFIAFMQDGIERVYGLGVLDYYA